MTMPSLEMGRLHELRHRGGLVIISGTEQPLRELTPEEAGKHRALAIHLQQSIVIERKIVCVQSVVLPLEGTTGELHRRIRKYPQRLARSGGCGSLRKSNARQCRRCGHF
jgi:hypothetical protein